MANSIYTDVKKHFILPDKKALSRKYLKARLGIRKTDKGSETVTPKKAAKYLVLKRLYMVRLSDSDGIFLYDFVLNYYVKVDNTTLAKIVLEVLSEYDPDLFYVGIDRKIIDYMNIYCRQLQLRQLNGQLSLVHFPNGTYDVRTHSFTDNIADYGFCTNVVDYEYDENAGEPKRFLAFLDDIFEGDSELIALVRDMFGYTFWNGNEGGCFFYLTGSGRNGKSILASILQSLHGDELCSGTSLQKLTTEKFALSELYQKRINISSENGEDIVKNTEIIKGITGQDKLSIEAKYMPSFSARLSVKLITLSNFPLHVNDTSFALFERLIAIPFGVTYHKPVPKAERKPSVKYQDPFLLNKLKAELPAIFLWAMEALKDLEARKFRFTPCKKAEQLKHAYRRINNPLIDFISCLEADDTARIRSTEMYRKFKRFIEQEEMTLPDKLKTPQGFHTALKQLLDEKNVNYQFKKSNGSRYYLGLKLK